MPEADGNEAIAAFVELEPGAALDPDALQAHLRQHLSPYKRPSRITVLDALPTTSTGKILKRALAPPACADHQAGAR